MQNKVSYPGTFPAQKKDGTIYYRASITYKNKHISLGSFKSPEESFAAYKTAGDLVNSELTIEDYTSDCPLKFEKWVVLVNFRDNNLYFPNPIYIRKKFFSYYLDPYTELKFSIDDLFYYASHKIMRRGGHFFVADYGMQINILNRYGIKNYGVAGKDYEHKNADPFDFRYENITVHNEYNGVYYTTYHGKPAYQAKINLHGYFIVGYYDTALEAAIAYNKAIDVAKKRGCTKNFKQNYTEGVSPSVYADIYSKLKISSKIMDYTP